MNRVDNLTSDEQILARATKHAIQAAGGLEVCASETALSTSQLSRCCSPNERDSLTIRDANTIEAIGHGAAGHPHILRALARLQGYVLIKTPEAHGDGDGILQSVMELTVELGDVASSIHDAMRDSDFKPSEAVRSIEQLDELDEASAKLRLKLKSIADSTNKR